MLWEDTPRARTTDPTYSHLAADRTQASMRIMKHRVLLIVAELGPISGQQLNTYYREVSAAKQWPAAAYESPRRRAGDLAADGFLQDARTHPTEAHWVLSFKGIEAIS